MSRKALTLVAMLLVAAVGGVATPVAATPGSGTFDTATAERIGITTFNTSDAVNHFGKPSWIVHYSDGERSSLETWAESSSDRHLVATFNDSNRAVVSASPKAMGATSFMRLLGQGLAGRNYVESVRLNTVLSKVEPVTLRNESALEAPTAGIFAESYRTEGAYSPRGIAFKSDAEATTLQEARTMTGADEVDTDTSGITVAVVDTGVNTAGGQVFGNGSRGSDLRIDNASKDFIQDETVNESGVDAVADPNGHGTHVASTIAADYNGTEHDGYAPNASILALRALDAEGSGSSADIAQAVRYAAAQDADVISLSLGSPTYSAEIVDAVENATEQGSVVVVAAGNSRQTTRWLATPADAPVDGVVSVAAANHSTNASNAAVGYFSQLGEDPGTTDLSEGATAGQDVTVSSVGMKLTAKTPDESGSVSSTTLTGTSMAAPTVSGAIAQALAANPSWKDDPATVAEKVETTARPLPKAATQETGAGLLAVDNLVTDSQPDEEQSEAMTETAQERETFWTWLSDSSGGVFEGLW